jgi:hypothetical protein
LEITQEFAGEEATKRTSKTTKLYTGGMCNDVRDVLITVYNLYAVISYLLKDMKPNQRPTLITSMLSMEDKLRDPRADINRSAEHLPHCLPMDFQAIFGLFVNIAGNMEYCEAAEQGNPINPQVLEQAEAQAGELTRNWEMQFPSTCSSVITLMSQPCSTFSQAL